MIIGFIGTVGSGKTLGMTREGYKYHLKGMKVFANYGLDFPHEKLTSARFTELIQENTQLQDCVIMLDELHVWLDSRNSMKKKNKTITYFILQTRKRNVRLLYTTQHFDQVDKRLRNTTDILVFCRNVTNQKSITEVGLTLLEQEYFFQYGHSPARRYVYLANQWYDLYDTSEIIDFTDQD